MFKHIAHDGYSFYVIQDTGALCWYRDAAGDGTDSWATNTGNAIGTGWGDVTHFFAGSDPGELYAVDTAGNLRWFRDTLRDGSNGPAGNHGWASGSGGVIAEGWNQYLWVFPGPNGVIYAVKPTGELLWFRDLKKTVQIGIGKFSRLANGGVGKQIGVGWNQAQRIVACRKTAPPQSSNDYVIYLVKTGGGLYWYHDDRADGSNDPKGHTGWAPLSGSQIGLQWDQATDVVGAAAGVLYLVKPDGSLRWYKDLRGDGTNGAGGGFWADKSGSQVGKGWFRYPATLPPTLQWDFDSLTFNDGTPVGGNAHVTVKSDGTFSFWGHFHNSGLIDYNISLVTAVKDANDKAYTFSVNGHMAGGTGSGSHDFDFGPINGNNDDLVTNWAALVAHSSAQCNYKTDSDLNAVTNLALQAIGTVLAVVGLVLAGMAMHQDPQKGSGSGSGPNAPQPGGSTVGDN